MTYTKALEALDARRGYVHTSLDWRRIGEKAVEDLTDDDLTVLEGFEGPTCTARARRAKALAPPPPPAPPAPVTTSAQPTKLPKPREDESWDDYVKRCRALPVPMAFFDAYLKAMKAKNLERNQRLEALEHRNASLASQVAFEGAQRSAQLKSFEARLLELEAERAVTHGDR